jgi:hypothetical protein
MRHKPSYNRGQHSSNVVVSSPIVGDRNQSTNPGGSKKKPLLATRNNRGKASACGTYGWFGPSY